jgi:hypothetical protein
MFALQLENPHVFAEAIRFIVKLQKSVKTMLLQMADVLLNAIKVTPIAFVVPAEHIAAVNRIA